MFVGCSSNHCNNLPSFEVGNKAMVYSSLDENMSNFLACSCNLSILENFDMQLLIYLKYTHIKDSGWNLDAAEEKK